MQNPAYLQDIETRGRKSKGLGLGVCCCKPCKPIHEVRYHALFGDCDISRSVLPSRVPGVLRQLAGRSAHELDLRLRLLCVNQRKQVRASGREKENE